MTDTIDDMAAKAAGQEPAEAAFDEQGVAEQLVAPGRGEGHRASGPDGLLSQLTKRVLETELEAEMTAWTEESTRPPTVGDHVAFDIHFR
jgi:hypothetical protein